MTRSNLHLSCVFCAVFASSAAFADEPRILDVSVSQQGMDWRVDVTLEHPDTGWDHYADGWEVLDADGNRIGYRKLHHPHVQEQPFTRSLSNVMIPDGAQEIFVRVSCSVDNWAGQATRIALNP